MLRRVSPTVVVLSVRSSEGESGQGSRRSRLPVLRVPRRTQGCRRGRRSHRGRAGTDLRPTRVCSRTSSEVGPHSPVPPSTSVGCIFPGPHDGPRVTSGARDRGSHPRRRPGRPAFDTKGLPPESGDGTYPVLPDRSPTLPSLRALGRDDGRRGPRPPLRQRTGTQSAWVPSHPKCPTTPLRPRGLHLSPPRPSRPRPVHAVYVGDMGFPVEEGWVPKRGVGGQGASGGGWRYVGPPTSLRRLPLTPGPRDRRVGPSDLQRSLEDN